MNAGKACCLLCVLLLAACARQPARCERPLGLEPAPPRAGDSRRVVATLDQPGACHVQLRLPESTPPEEWAAARDAALASAELAAHTCCAHPRATNVAAWAPGATSFAVAYTCQPER